MRVIVLVVAAAAALSVAAAAPASAGGANLQPVLDRYEPGDMATLVGYVTPSASGGWVGDGPYFAYVETGPSRSIPAGPLELGSSRLGPGVLRVTLSFPVPDDLPPGHYRLHYCNDPCAKSLGDLAAGTLHVGVDPVQPIVREWPFDEPEIANLPPGARVVPPPLAPAVSPASVPAAPAPAAPAGVERPQSPAPRAAPAPEANLTPLVLGGALAAVCTGMVLVALRDG